MRKPRSTVLGAALFALALFAAACGDGGPGGDGSLTVGADNFAESEIVAEMYAQVLENDGWDVSTEFGTTRETRIPAMENGEIDVAPEYVATLLLFLNPDAETSSDPQELLGPTNELLDEKGLTLLEPSPAVDTNAFVVTQETADEFGLQSMSDLAAVAGDLTLGGPPECPERPFCIPGLQDVYGIEFGEFVPLDAGGPLTIEALSNGDIDVGLLFSTQSVIAENGWVLLEDDKGLQAADNLTPLVSQDIADDVRETLDAVSALLTTQNMTELNGRVEIDGEDPADVARDFLEENGLL
jgi:osmoprotectant transport system substrate-binding protein